MLFDTFDATDLNKELKSLMDGLSVKVGGGGGGGGGTGTVHGLNTGFWWGSGWQHMECARLS
mgnify:CR=1 FL=1